MKLRSITAAVVAAILFITLALPALAAETSLKFGDGNENSFVIELPGGYTAVTAEDINRDSSYFENLPITKNEAVDKFNEGALLLAFASDKSGEVSVYATDNGFASQVGNFTPLPESAKATVISDLKSILENNGQILLDDPSVITLGEYSFIRYSARVGASEKGYSYISAITVIGGTVYEITCYSESAIPDEETAAASEKVLRSARLKIKGDKAQLSSNRIQTVLSYIAVAAAVIVAILCIVSIVNAIRHRRSAETVRLKKRN